MIKTRQSSEAIEAYKPPHDRLRWMIGAVASCLLIVSLAWMAAQHALDRTLDRTLQAARQAGLQVTIAQRHRAGWPISASLVLDGLQVDGSAPEAVPGADFHNRALHWASQRLVLQASLLHPLDVALIAQGTQRLRAGPLPGATFWGDRVAVYLPWRPRLPLVMPLEARALHAAADGSGPDWMTTIAGIGGRLRLAPGGDLAVELALTGITLPQAGRHPFGRVVDRLSLSAALPPGIGEPRWPDGQPVLLQAVSLDWASLHLALSGRLSLDPLVGQFALDLHGLRGALRDASIDGDLAPGVALALNGLAGLLEGARDQSRNGAADDTLRGLPLRLHDGALYLDAIPLWRIGTSGPFSSE